MKSSKAIIPVLLDPLPDGYMGPQFRQLSVMVRSARCSNRCRNCSIDGGRSCVNRVMPAAQILAGLERLSTLCSQQSEVRCLIYEDPFDHPEIEEIIELLWRRKFRNVIEHQATHGAGIARWTRPLVRLAALRKYGVRSFQFTFHGFGKNHDWFVCRDGAFDEIVLAAKRCLRAGFEVCWSVLANPRNLGEIEPLVAFLLGLSGARTRNLQIRCSDIDRGRWPRAKGLRLHLSDYERLQTNLGEYVGSANPESWWVAQALAGDLTRFPLMKNLASFAHLRIEPDQRVWHDWSDLPAELGQLQMPLETIVSRYMAVPATEPQVLLTRDRPALRSLAERFGDPASNIVYSGRSIVSTWVARYRQGLVRVQC